MARTAGPLLEHLPGIYHASSDLSDLLTVMEEMLFGPAPDGTAGLEQQVASLARLFTPDLNMFQGNTEQPGTPAEFLPWLAQWVALGNTAGLPEKQLRKLIAHIVPLYAKRGTQSYMEEMLRYFLPDDFDIAVDDRYVPTLIVGASHLGLQSWLGIERPYWFQVSVARRAVEGGTNRAAHDFATYERTIRSVIDLAKPAHTLYHLLSERREPGQPTSEPRHGSPPAGSSA